MITTYDPETEESLLAPAAGLGEELGLILPFLSGEATGEATGVDSPPDSTEPEAIISAEQAGDLERHYEMKPAGSGLMLPAEYTQDGIITRTADFLRGTRAGRTITAFAVAASLAGGYSLIHAESARADDTTPVCTTAPGGDSTTCVYPPNNQQPNNPPSDGNGNGDNGGNHQGSGNGGGHNGGKNHHPHHHDGNLLPLPKHHTNRYWATMILNEIRQGNRGTISASPPAKHTLDLTRRGKCSPVEMVPGACVKLDKTLLETLYKASQIERFRINYTVNGNHVTCSDHYQGRAADLSRYNGSRPHNRSLLHIFAHVLHNLPGHPTAQLLGPGDPGHSGLNAHWHIGITGPNNICE